MLKLLNKVFIHIRKQKPTTHSINKQIIKLGFTQIRSAFTARKPWSQIFFEIFEMSSIIIKASFKDARGFITPNNILDIHPLRISLSKH